MQRGWQMRGAVQGREWEWQMASPSAATLRYNNDGDDDGDGDDGDNDGDGDGNTDCADGEEPEARMKSKPGYRQVREVAFK